MILTVTLHTALDKVIFIDEWKPGLVMRSSKVLTCVGGKGLDASIVLSQLGIPTTGLCFVAGKTGVALIERVHEYGAVTEPVWVNGETRTAHVIVEQLHNRHSHLITGALEITPQHCHELLQAFGRLVSGAAYVVCAGSIPPGVPADFFGTLTRLSHQAGVPILVDSSSAGIHSALQDTPDILKMNWDEYVEAFQVQAPTLDELKIRAAETRRRYDLDALVITCGGDGLLVFTPQGAIQAAAPRQPSVNAAGAGDAASAALAWRRSLGESWDKTLRWAAAVGAATVLTEGTAECRMEDVQRILPQVRVQEMQD